MKPNHEDCVEFENNLALYVGGDLETEAVGTMARHAESCAECREREGRARGARDLLVSTLRVTERRGPDLWSGVRAGLVSEGLLRPEPVAAPAPRRTLRMPYVMVGAAAAVLVGFFLGRSFLTPERSDVGPGPSPILTSGPSAGGNSVREPEIAIPDAPAVLGESTLAESTGLRRLRPDEAPLREGATIYTGFEWEDGPVLPDPNGATPASLRSAGAPR